MNVGKAIGVVILGFGFCLLSLSSIEGKAEKGSTGDVIASVIQPTVVPSDTLKVTTEPMQKVMARYDADSLSGLKDLTYCYITMMQNGEVTGSLEVDLDNDCLTLNDEVRHNYLTWKTWVKEGDDWVEIEEGVDIPNYNVIYWDNLLDAFNDLLADEQIPEGTRGELQDGYEYFTRQTDNVLVTTEEGKKNGYRRLDYIIEGNKPKSVSVTEGYHSGSGDVESFSAWVFSYERQDG